MVQDVKPSAKIIPGTPSVPAKPEYKKEGRPYFAGRPAVPEVPERVVLEISREQAHMLMVAIGGFGGSLTWPVYNALQGAGIYGAGHHSNPLGRTVDYTGQIRRRDEVPGLCPKPF